MNNKPDEVKAPKFLAKNVEAVEGCIFTLGNGQTITVLLADMPPEILKRLAKHGLSQKVGDSTANCAADKAYGHAFAQMQATITALQAGKWGAERESNSRDDIIDAIAKLKKLDREAVAVAVRKATPEMMKSWEKNPKIAAEVLAIKSARAKAVAKGAEEDFDFPM